MADVYSLSIRADTRDVTRAKAALEGLANGSIKAQRATQQLTNVSVRAGRQIKLNTQLINQAGFQVGDFATQIASGGNALVAFTQQFGQLAGFLGPSGPILGAIVAIGGAVSIGLVNAFGEAEESTEDLTERTKELVTQLGEATQLQREFINAQFQQSIQEQNQAIIEAEETIRSVNARLEDFRRAVGDNVPEAVFNSNSAVQSLRDELTAAGLTIDNANSAIQAITENQEKFWKEVEETSTKLEDSEKKLANFVAGIQAQADTIGMSARQTALYEAARLGANEADLQAINNAFDLIEAERQRMNLQKAMQESSKVKPGDDPILQRIEAQRRAQEILAEESAMWAQKIEQNQKVIQQQSVATVGASIGAMQSFFEQGSAEFIAFGLLQKGLMAGQAVMAANLAATLALTAQVPGDPTGPARAIAQAEAIRALGYINAGLILATGIGEAIQGSGADGARALGGSVSAGGSYLVGENGPEIVTMGGSGVVTPSSVTNNGGAVNQTLVFQISGDVTERTRQEIMKAMPMIRQQSVQAVVQASNQGGAMSRAVGRRS